MSLLKGFCKIECFLTSPQSSPKRRGSILFSFSSIGEGWDEVDKRRTEYQLEVLANSSKKSSRDDF